MNDSHEAIRRFAHIRPDYIYRSIFTNLGYNWVDRFYVSLSVGDGGGAIMNSRPVGERETVLGNYFSGTSIRITAVPNAGYQVEYWLVDGVEVLGDVVTVSDDASIMLNFVLLD